MKSFQLSKIVGRSVIGSTEVPHERSKCFEAMKFIYNVENQKVKQFSKTLHAGDIETRLRMFWGRAEY